MLIALLAAGALMLPATFADAGGRRTKAPTAKVAGTEVDGPASTRLGTRGAKAKKAKKARKTKKATKAKKAPKAKLAAPIGTRK